MSPALESSRLIKKRCYSALRYNVSYSPKPDTSEVSSRCVACIVLLWLSCFRLQSSFVQWFSLPVVDRVSPSFVHFLGYLQ